MLKILIADRSTAFSKRLAEELSALFEVQVCCTGRQALEVYSTYRPDMMVLELELPELDGFGVLRTLRAAGHNVKTLALSGSLESNYVQQLLVQHGVEFALPKPCAVAAAVARLQEMACVYSGREWSDDDEITSLLLMLGFRVKNGGFQCVHEALRVLRADRMLPVTKVVYPEVSKVCGGSNERIERAVRGAIKTAYLNRDDRVWRYFFAPGRDGTVSCPSNAEFLRRMALCLKNKKIV